MGGVTSGAFDLEFRLALRPPRPQPARAHPPIRLVPSAQTQLQIVVGERFGEFAVGIVADDVQRDRVDASADEAAHERQLLLGRQLAQDAVAFAGDVHRDLIRHRAAGVPGRAE